jgi:hypothetical protein
MADVESTIQSASASLARVEGELEALEKRDRSEIAQRVVWLYAGVIAAAFLFVFVFFWFFPECSAGGTETGGCGAWQEPAEFLLKIITSAVLPIVTLVLGYYFGTAKTKG